MDRAVLAVLLGVPTVVSGGVGWAALNDASSNGPGLTLLGTAALACSAMSCVLAVRATRLQLAVADGQVRHRGLTSSCRVALNERPRVRSGRLINSPNSPLVLVLMMDNDQPVKLLATLNHSAAGRAEIASQAHRQGWRGDLTEFVEHGF